MGEVVARLLRGVRVVRRMIVGARGVRAVRGPVCGVGAVRLLIGSLLVEGTGGGVRTAGARRGRCSAPTGLEAVVV